ncbi:MAG: class IV adenylate cyclase [Thermoanaerobaculum sp.]
MGSGLEQELKFRVGSLEVLRGLLSQHGAHRESPPDLERNWVLDDVAGSLRARGVLLRVRTWGCKAWLTFKGPATFEGGIKSRQEIETEVANGEVTLAILSAVGFAVAFYYEKKRELWRWGDVAVALDETPMGSFVELEGPPGALAPCARSLGLELDHGLRASYLELWGEHRRRYPRAPAFMVFSSSGPTEG